MYISAKSKNPIIVAVNATRYYTQVGRSITTANMSWITLASFDMQWQALLKQENQDDPEVLKLGKNGSILKWIESFKLHTKSIIGVRMCSLLYALENEASKATARPDLIAHQPHSADYGSIIEEIAALTSHDNPLYAQDNGNVYERIERSLTGTSHSSAIIRFRRTRDGKGEMDALVSQFYRKVVWEIRIKDAHDYLMNKQWYGTTHQTLKAIIDRHKSTFVSLSASYPMIGRESATSLIVSRAPT